MDNIFSNNFSNETTNGILYYDISDHLPIFMINNKIDISNYDNDYDISNYDNDISNYDNEPKYRRTESENNIAFPHFRPSTG